MPSIHGLSHNRMVGIDGDRLKDSRILAAYLNGGVFRIDTQDILTDTLGRVFTLAALGRSALEIGSDIDRSSHTVSVQLKQVRRLLGGRSMTSAVNIGFDNKMFRVIEQTDDYIRLTSTEVDILDLTATGMTAIDIAESRGTFDSTVRTQQNMIRRKLKVNNLTSAVTAGYLTGHLPHTPKD